MPSSVRTSTRIVLESFSSSCAVHSVFSSRTEMGYVLISAILLTCPPLSFQNQYADHGSRHQSRERTRNDRAQPERHDLLAPLRHHGGEAADQDADAAEVREAAQAVGHDQAAARGQG